MLAPRARSAPQLLTDISADDWRKRLAWPLPQPLRAELTLRVVDEFLAWFGGIADPELRRIVCLAGPILIRRAARILVWASELDAAVEQGVAIETQHLMVAWLSGQGLLPPSPPIAPGRQWGWREHLRLLSDARNSLRLTSPVKGVAALVAPEATALNFAPLLEQYARHSGSRVRYRQGIALLEKARARFGAWGNEGDSGLAVAWTNRLLSRVKLGGSSERAAAAILAAARQVLETAAGDLKALKLLRLGDAVWCGSGGNHPSRAIGLEVLRRGGEVVRFAHGGAAGLDDYLSISAFVDILPSSKFVMATSALAALLQRQLGTLSPAPETVVAGAGGDPTFRNVPVHNPRPKGMRPRVLFVTTLFTGELLHLPPALPDPIYFDWQLRLIEMLSAQPIELVVKPHPENFMFWQRQPIRGHATCDERPFQTALADADLVLFDWPLSTTFWEALCSDRRLLLVNACGVRFAPEVDGLVRRRCDVLGVSYDENGVPHVDGDALVHTIFAGKSEADPQPFRTLLADA